MNLGRIVNLARRMEGRWLGQHDTRAVLVNARTAMNYAVIRPLYERMRQDNRVMFYFTASETPKRARQIYRELPTDARVISPRLAMLMKFDAYIAADLLWLKLPRGTRRIQMFHGVAGKYAHIYDTPDRSMRAWDRIFFINERRLRNFIAARAIDRGSRSARLVGYPKLDCLVDGTWQRDRVLASLGIDPKRTTVLYAPTWSPYSSLNTMGEELVRLLCAAGLTVIVKLHDRSRDSEYHHSGGVDWGSRFSNLLTEHGGVLADSSDATPYLAAADVLVTDHSSVGFEYLLLDRPVIRIEMPELIRATNVGREYVSLLSEAAFSVRTAAESLAAVEKALSDPTAGSSRRRSVASELFYKPGTATARATRELCELLELEPLAVQAGLQAVAD